ncbi:DUF427 domain-containing protein [Rhodococcoides kyotonense]|uniref:Uncharacterized conserved protein, DUF427 family n=1 Tax=Rhodococcoides kyotonense TaxID=398843 RepID=A0A239GD45_9NOCA|nr:DUF427 domain-containing protein [Rhodococcus kyotonensis]SNS66718.1 Uncharacterized conserved protein, DUF427 family [Rhodococcus kyotonensis]
MALAGHTNARRTTAANGTVSIEPNPRRIRAYFAGEVVVDTTESVYLFEDGHLPAYYIPWSDVRTAFLVPSDTSTVCPRKGTAEYRSIAVGDQQSTDALWTYPQPLDDALDLSGYVSFYWDRVDAWFEEDEQVFVHPRDPYVRVDVLASSRHVEVFVGDVLVAETHRPKILFETGLPPRYYVPRIDVKNWLFTDSATTTACPYKGTASYVSLKGGPADVAWFYPQTTPAASGIEDHLSFYPDRGTRVLVDGVELGG